MKITLLRRYLTLAILAFSVFLTGCSAGKQMSPASDMSPMVMPSATSTDPPPTPSLAIPAAETPSTTATPILQSNATSQKDNASFVSETYPDNSKLKPGEHFVKVFEIKNTSSTTWTSSYALALDQTSQAGETLASPAQIPFSQETPPGGKLVIQIPLVAPDTPGTYTVYWSLKNDHGETIPVDGGRNIWAKILICDPNHPCNPPVTGGAAAAGGVSATLTNFTSGVQSGVASFCMTLPNRNYGPTPGTVSLIVDQQSILASTGGSLDAGCFEFEFPVALTQIQQARSVAVSISQVRIIGGTNDPDGTCQSIRPNLIARYPGLDFQCHFSMAGYYSNLQVPPSLTPDQAKQIIIDTIEGAINGPWVLTVR